MVWCLITSPMARCLGQLCQPKRGFHGRHPQAQSSSVFTHQRTFLGDSPLSDVHLNHYHHSLTRATSLFVHLSCDGRGGPPAGRRFSLCLCSRRDRAKRAMSTTHSPRGCLLATASSACGGRKNPSAKCLACSSMFIVLAALASARLHASTLALAKHTLERARAHVLVRAECNVVCAAQRTHATHC